MVDVPEPEAVFIGLGVVALVVGAVYAASLAGAVLFVVVALIVLWLTYVVLRGVTQRLLDMTSGRSGNGGGDR